MIVLTSVKGVFNGTHTDPDTDVLHGHDYEITAGWLNSTERFELLKARLDGFLRPLDHALLPDGIWSAEDLGRWLFPRLGCAELIINRPSIGHSVTVTQMDSRSLSGGLEPRFIIERADGKPIDPSRRYSLVLDFSGSDPSAIVAANAYADHIEPKNPQLAADIRAALADPDAAPAQHRYAA